MTSLERKLTTDVLVSGLLSISTRVRGLFILPIITVQLGVPAYGAYMQLLAVTGILGLISSFSLKQGYVNFSQREEIDRARLYYSLLVIVLLGAIISSFLIALYSKPISRITLSAVEYTDVFAVGGALIPATALSNMGSGFYRGEMRIKISSGIRAARDYLRISAIILVVYGFEGGLIDVIKIVVVVELISGVVIQSMVIKQLGITIPRMSHIPEVIQYSIWMTLSSLSGQLSARADRLMLGYFIGASAVGIYSIAYGLASLLLILLVPVRNTFFPEFSRLLESGQEGKVEMYTIRGIQFFLALAIPGVVGLFFVSEPLISLFADTTNSPSVSEIVTVIGIGIILKGVSELQSTGLFAAKMSKPVALTWGGATIGNILLNIVLIPIIGVAGAAVATAVTYAASCVAVFVLYRTRFNMEYGLKRILRFILATCGMAIGLSVLPSWSLPTTILSGVTIYIILLVLIGGLRLGEIKSLLT